MKIRTNGLWGSFKKLSMKCVSIPISFLCILTILIVALGYTVLYRQSHSLHGLRSDVVQSRKSIIECQEAHESYIRIIERKQRELTPEEWEEFYDERLKYTGRKEFHEGWIDKYQFVIDTLNKILDLLDNGEIDGYR